MKHFQVCHEVRAADGTVLRSGWSTVFGPTVSEEEAYERSHAKVRQWMDEDENAVLFIVHPGRYLPWA